MADDSREPAPWRLFLRALGYGAGCGALLGIASLAPLVAQLVVHRSDVPIVVLYCVCAALVGGVVGSVVGLLGGAVLVMADADKPGNERRARPLAGATAGAPFIILVMLGLGADPEAWSGSWILDGWLLVFVTISVLTGAAVGPRVARGRPDRLRGRPDDRRARGLRRIGALR